MSVLHDVTKALIFYVSREKRLWVERKPADDDPLVLRVQEYEKLIDAAEREMALGAKKWPYPTDVNTPTEDEE